MKYIVVSDLPKDNGVFSVEDETEALALMIFFGNRNSIEEWDNQRNVKAFQIDEEKTSKGKFLKPFAVMEKNPSSHNVELCLEDEVLKVFRKS